MKKNMLNANDVVEFVRNGGLVAEEGLLVEKDVYNAKIERIGENGASMLINVPYKDIKAIVE